jgi:hypothetical protein
MKTLKKCTIPKKKRMKEIHWGLVEYGGPCLQSQLHKKVRWEEDQVWSLSQAKTSTI